MISVQISPSGGEQSLCNGKPVALGFHEEVTKWAVLRVYVLTGVLLIGEVAHKCMESFLQPKPVLGVKVTRENAIVDVELPIQVKATAFHVLNRAQRLGVPRLVQLLLGNLKVGDGTFEHKFGANEVALKPHYHM